MKKQATIVEPAPPSPVTRPLCWETFFRCQPQPVLRSELLTALLCGTPLEVARIPTVALLDVVLLATAARECCGAEIIDDYMALLQRTQDTWSQPDWSCKVFASLHGHWANCILNGTRNFDSPEDGYIPSMVEWYIDHGMPNYFSRELTEKDLKKRDVSKVQARQSECAVLVKRAGRSK